MDILYWTKKSKKKENHFDSSRSGGSERGTGTHFPLILIDQSQEVTPEPNSNDIYSFCDRAGQKLILLPDLTTAPAEIPLQLTPAKGLCNLSCEGWWPSFANFHSAHEKKKTQTFPGNTNSWTLTFSPYSENLNNSHWVITAWLKILGKRMLKQKCVAEPAHTHLPSPKHKHSPGWSQLSVPGSSPHKVPGQGSN